MPTRTVAYMINRKRAFVHANRLLSAIPNYGEGTIGVGVGVGIGIDKTNGHSTPIPIPTPTPTPMTQSPHN